MNIGIAERAADSARALYDDGDARGAINRAYYAMFYAARTSLVSLEPSLAITKRHGEVISRFSKHVVLHRGLNRALGRSFNEVFKKRIASDYRLVEVDLADAHQISLAADEFLDAIKAAKLDTSP